MIRLANRILVSLSVLCAIGLSDRGWAADHNDGLFGLTVEVGLAAGPPYAAAPVEIGSEIRHGGAAAVTVSGLHLTLRDADDGTGAPLALTGMAEDNGEPFGETGDTVILDVYYDPGTPPADLPQVTGFSWGLRPDPSPAPDTPPLEFTNAEPATLEVELFFEAYEATAHDAVSGELIGHGRIQTRFEIAAGQDLSFEGVQTTPPDATGEVRYTGSLRRVAGGSFDPNEPLYRITIANAPPMGLPATRPFGVALVALAIAAGAFFGIRRVRSATATHT